MSFTDRRWQMSPTGTGIVQTETCCFRKLYYQEKLNWPQEAILDLYEAEKQFGLTKRIIQSYCDYYYKNGRYFELLKAVSVARSLEKPDATIQKYEVIGHIHVSPSDVAHFLFKQIPPYF